MANQKARWVLLLAMMFPAAGCDDQRRRIPISPTPPTSELPSFAVPVVNPDSPPRPEPHQMSFEMTGIVTDEAGTPVPRATVRLLLDVDADYLTQPSVLTNASGHYSIKFSGVPGSNYLPGLDPGGTREAVGFVSVESPDFEQFVRWIIGSEEHLVENIRLRRRKRIAAGESATVTVAPDDTICVIDVWPGREFVCSFVDVSPAARTGILSIELLPIQTGLDLAYFSVWSDGAYYRGPVSQSNLAAIPVAAGAECHVEVELPWGFEGIRSFVVKTSMQ